MRGGAPPSVRIAVLQLAYCVMHMKGDHMVLGHHLLSPLPAGARATGHMMQDGVREDTA